MGEVFLAEQLGPLGPVRPVALKRMLPQLAQDARVSRMFLEEMAIVAQLNHPAIATTYDFGEIDGVYFIAMEYVEGLTLSTIESAIGSIGVPEMLTIVRAVADALSFSHNEKKPVVHCDVSPQNVMVSLRGGVKLLDFGIAAAEAALSEHARGKLSYAAPEQILGEPPDRRFDIWSLGVLTYEALANTKPAGAETGNYVRLAQLRPELSGISKVIDRALAPNIQDRWPSAAAFADALHAATKYQPAPPAKLSDLVQRSGGVKAIDEPSEMTATGMAVVSPAATSPTVTTPDPRPAFNLAWIAAITGAIVLVAAIYSVKTALDSAPKSIPLPEEKILVPAKVLAKKVEPQVELAPPVEEAAPPLKVDPEPVPKKKKVRADKTERPLREERPPVEPIIAEANGLGVLSVRTTPWAKVSLDGKSLGEGVVAAKPVPAGKHTLVLTPGDGRFAPKTLPIEIRVGVATKVFVDFETGATRIDP
jgi:serine/threonine-protein kinase